MEEQKQKFHQTPGFRVGLKLAVLIVLLLILLIPLALIRAVVEEREQRRDAALTEIVDLQGGSQLIVGPLVSLPVTVGYVDDQGVARSRTETVMIVPSELRVDAAIVPEVLSRGIYQVPVYEVAGTIEGAVGLPTLDQLPLANVRRVHWDQAELVLGISGVAGIRTSPTVTIDGTEQAVASSGGVGPASAGVAAPLRGAGPQTQHRFTVALALSGGGGFHMLPTAIGSSVAIDSSWPSPSFSGDLLPTERQLSDDGFSATWETTALGMGMPPLWVGGRNATPWLNSSRVGVELYQPVGHYQQTLRSVKYGALFLLLPFAALFLLEVFTGVRIHPIQYLFVAAAKTVFYLLLLSLSEQIAFEAAYWIGAAATAVLVAVYVGAFLYRRGHAWIIGAMITGEYLFLFAALQSEDYALLIGSLGLFALVALMMIVTRKIDWYRGAATDAAGSEPTVRN